MRFFKDGPSIPDELLNARDEGRVVFFCGAGVSRARAGLLDFFGLANEVIALLRVHKDSPVHKVLHEAGEIEARTGVGGLISADRLFGLLEREFAVNEIWTAVAKALRPTKDVDVSAHRILLDLAKTPYGGVRLVTTNFDRLFDLCDPELKIWHSSRLPDLDRAEKWHGVIHLHGRATVGYDGAEEDGFVLSSSEFGRAYLSDGWATNFFREILDRYVVVFVGYTADDPPVQYLLEGLNKKGSKLNGVYAFQAGLGNTATSIGGCTRALKPYLTRPTMIIRLFGIVWSHGLFGRSHRKTGSGPSSLWLGVALKILKRTSGVKSHTLSARFRAPPVFRTQRLHLLLIGCVYWTRTDALEILAASESTVNKSRLPIPLTFTV